MSETFLLHYFQLNLVYQDTRITLQTVAGLTYQPCPRTSWHGEADVCGHFLLFQLYMNVLSSYRDNGRDFGRYRLSVDKQTRDKEVQSAAIAQRRGKRVRTTDTCHSRRHREGPVKYYIDHESVKIRAKVRM